MPPWQEHSRLATRARRYCVDKLRRLTVLPTLQRTGQAAARDQIREALRQVIDAELGWRLPAARVRRFETKCTLSAQIFEFGFFFDCGTLWSPANYRLA
jgi:hypothetical protein